MKIAFVSCEYPPLKSGGIGTFVQTMARALVKEGHQVTVATLGEHDVEDNDQGVKVKRFDIKSKKIMKFLPLTNPFRKSARDLLLRYRITKWLKKEVEKGNIEIIETHDFKGLMCFKFNACPVVNRLHLSMTDINKHAGKKTRMFTRWAEKRTLSLFPNWIAVSSYILNQTKETFKIKPQKSTVIYNPVVLSDEIETDKDFSNLPYVLFAGSISARKGALLLANSANKFMSEYPSINLLYTGRIMKHDNRPIDHVIRNILSKDVNKRVHFLGKINRDRLLGIMQNAQAFIFPSTLEACPMVIIEAMLCGTPAVALDVPPMDELIENGETGILVNENTPEALSKAVVNLLQDSAKRKKITENAKKEVKQKFSIEKCVKETLEFYNQFL